MARLKRNIGYQTAYQMINTCLPLITAPYLARYLGAEKLGLYSYASSVSGYFVLFAMLGVSNYGTRCIAEIQSNRNIWNRTFGEIYTVQMCSGALCLLLYGLYLLLYSGEDLLIFLIQGIAVFACLLDISWLFFGLEQFRFLVIRSSAIRIASVALILLLVKRPSDLWLYALIMVGGTLINHLVLWTRIRKFIRFCRTDWASVRRHIKPMLMLFFPLLAMSVYHLMDKTMLGMLSPFDQGGYYNNADKLISIPTSVLTGIGAVLLPRVSALLKENQEKESVHLLFCGLEGITAAACAMAFGISAIAKEFVPFFFGNGYEPCIALTYILSPVLLIKSISLIIRNAYLIPNHHDKQYIWSVVFGAVCNLIANIILIPRFGAIGAAIGTIIAEAASCLWQLVFVGKKLPVWKAFLKNACYLLFGCVMFLCVRMIGDSIGLSAVPTILLQITTGIIVYGALCLGFWKLSKNTLVSTWMSNRKRCDRIE